MTPSPCGISAPTRMRLGEEAEQCSRPEEMDIPEELKRREERLAAIARAKEEIQARAQERFGRE